MAQIADKHCETDGAVRAQLQDNTNEIVSVRLCQKLADIVLASPVSVDSRTITLTGGHGTVNGNVICLKENGRHYQGIVTNVATNVITLDSPVDYAYSVSAVSYRSSYAMNVNGSVTPQVFSVIPPTGSKWHIYGMDLAITDNSAMDDALFGGLTALPNGIVFRKKDGLYKNFFNVKANGEFNLRATRVDYSSKAPAGSYGLNVELSFVDHNGCAIELDGTLAEEMQIIVQDDLTGLASFAATVSGHVTN